MLCGDACCVSVDFGSVVDSAAGALAVVPGRQEPGEQQSLEVLADCAPARRLWCEVEPLVAVRRRPLEGQLCGGPRVEAGALGGRC